MMGRTESGVDVCLTAVIEPPAEEPEISYCL